MARVAVWLGPHPEASARDGGKHNRRWLGHLPREPWFVQRCENNGVMLQKGSVGEARQARGSVHVGAIALLEFGHVCDGCLANISAEGRLLWDFLRRPLNAFTVSIERLAVLQGWEGFFARESSRSQDGVAMILSPMKGFRPYGVAGVGTSLFTDGSTILQRLRSWQVLGDNDEEIPP